MRVRETKALIKARQYSGAYYLAGYVVECALKAIIAKNTGVRTRRYEFPNEEDFALKKADYWTHSFATLVKTAGLDADLKAETQNNSLFNANWREVSGWRETSRYEIHTKQEAQSLIEAIENPVNGVLQWLKKYW